VLGQLMLYYPVCGRCEVDVLAIWMSLLIDGRVKGSLFDEKVDLVPDLRKILVVTPWEDLRIGELGSGIMRTGIDGVALGRYYVRLLYPLRDLARSRQTSLPLSCSQAQHNGRHYRCRFHNQEWEDGSVLI
jgi:hypothetical protein